MRATVVGLCVLIVASAGCDVVVPDAPAADVPAVDTRDGTGWSGDASADEPAVAPTIPGLGPAAPSASSPALPSASAPLASSAGPVASAGAPPCPADMVRVGRTCVDPYEAFLIELAADGSRKPHSHTERPVTGVTYVAASQAGHFPQGYISRVESAAACKAAGKRLCSKSEWQNACRGKGGARWPYGPSGRREKCNTGKLHLLTLEFPKVQGGLKYEEHFNSPILNAKPGWLAEAGHYDECVSDKGVYDMVGNLHEWVTGTVDQALIDEMAAESVERRQQPWRSGNGIFMGGFYSTTSEHGAGCDFITIAHEPTYHDYSTGFRCCRDADLPRPARKQRR